jgi:hypothetical protein
MEIAYDFDPWVNELSRTTSLGRALLVESVNHPSRPDMLVDKQDWWTKAWVWAHKLLKGLQD